ncbi:MAG TPA: cyclic nucleotide-binding domain-containing protein [Pirellulales bacterium]|nr:cyclic nucleotide-binding domain-containing protein [Pirellulales bacterium]
MPAPLSPELLQGVSLFDGLSASERQTLLEHFEELSLAGGETLFNVGDVGPALYVLLEGAVEIIIDAPGGQEALVTAIEPQGVFGESSFFHPAPHNATARCRVDSRLLRLPRPAYEKLLEQGATAAFRIGTKAAELLAARLQATDHWVSLLLGEEQQAITASWRRFRDGLGGSFEFPHGFIHPY